jgi:hypothetical protein
MNPVPIEEYIGFLKVSSRKRRRIRCFIGYGLNRNLTKKEHPETTSSATGA